MELQTVRVANPNSPTGYMIVNARDYREPVHGPLWHEQEPGFTGLLSFPEPARPYGAEENRRAANLMFEVLEVEREAKGLPTFASLSVQQRLTELDDKARELREHRATRLHRMEPPPRPKVHVPEGVVPGETPGWPIDLATGEPLDLSEEERAEIIRAARVEAEAAAAQVEPSATEAAAPTPTEQPSWLQPKPATTPVAESTVEKGPGGKWYVMQGGKPVSEGFKTKGEAEAATARTE